VKLENYREKGVTQVTQAEFNRVRWWLSHLNFVLSSVRALAATEYDENTPPDTIRETAYLLSRAVTSILYLADRIEAEVPEYQDK